VSVIRNDWTAMALAAQAVQDKRDAFKKAHDEYVDAVRDLNQHWQSQQAQAAFAKRATALDDRGNHVASCGQACADTLRTNLDQSKRVEAANMDMF